jgi:hypothetical protein
MSVNILSLFLAILFLQLNGFSEVNKNAHKSARELPYFRLSWMPKDYDRWQSSAIKRTKLSAKQIKDLPSRVDNSKHLAWPGIGNQGKKNCCSQEGTVAGMLTYEFNILNNRSATSASNRLPAHFSWNLFNSGTNSGAEMIHGLETAYEIGIPSQKSYGGRYSEKIGHWPNGYAVWHDAMKSRITGYDFMKVNNANKLQLAKAWLYNHAGWLNRSSGGMLTIDGTDVWHAPLKTIPKGNHEAGKKVWTDWGPKYGGHVMCVVGYDDKVGFDTNKDGKITNNIDITGDGKITLADYERGAFIIANSWGAKWGDKGKIYVLYRCLLSRNSFWDRGPFMGYAAAAKIQPRITLRLKAVYKKRNQLRLKVVMKDSKGNQTTWEPNVMFHKKTGAVPLGGPGTDNKDFEWGLDLTRMAKKLAGENIELLLNDLQKGKAKVEINLSVKTSKKDSKAKGLLKEAELKFWSKDDKQIHSESLLKKPRVIEN